MPIGMPFSEGWVMGNNDLDVPENSREIALHLRIIKMGLDDASSRIEALERAVGTRINNLDTTLNDRINTIGSAVDNLESSIVERRFKLQDILVASLLLPIIGGTVVALVPRMF